VTQYGQLREDKNNSPNSMQPHIPDRTTTFVRIGISLIVLGSALYVILSQNFPDESSKWAYGMVGIIIGYWLR